MSLKSFLGVFLFLIITSRCAPNNEKVLGDNELAPLLLFPIDSSASYFRTNDTLENYTSDTIDPFLNEWFSKMMFALKEPVLKDFEDEKDIYRFIWLRTFHHPASIRIEKQGNTIKLFSKMTSGKGGYEPGEIIFDTIINLSQKQIDTVDMKLQNAYFWNLPTYSSDDMIKDGSFWIYEIYQNKKYHLAIEGTPGKETDFRAIGEYFRDLAHLPTNKEERPYGDY